jgi:hypothetical protein
MKKNTINPHESIFVFFFEAPLTFPNYVPDDATQVG